MISHLPLLGCLLIVSVTERPEINVGTVQWQQDDFVIPISGEDFDLKNAQVHRTKKDGRIVVFVPGFKSVARKQNFLEGPLKSLQVKNGIRGVPIVLYLREKSRAYHRVQVDPDKKMVRVRSITHEGYDSKKYSKIVSGKRARKKSKLLPSKKNLKDDLKSPTSNNSSKEHSSVGASQEVSAQDKATTILGLSDQTFVNQREQKSDRVINDGDTEPLALNISDKRAEPSSKTGLPFFSQSSTPSKKTSSEVLGRQRDSMTSSQTLKMVGIGALLLVLGVGVWLWARKSVHLHGGPSDRIQVIASQFIAPKQRLMVVEAGGERLLLSSSDRDIKVLSHLGTSLKQASFVQLPDDTKDARDSDSTHRHDSFSPEPRNTVPVSGVDIDHTTDQSRIRPPRFDSRESSLSSTIAPSADVAGLLRLRSKKESGSEFHTPTNEERYAA